MNITSKVIAIAALAVAATFAQANNAATKAPAPAPAPAKQAAPAAKPAPAPAPAPAKAAPAAKPAPAPAPAKQAAPAAKPAPAPAPAPAKAAPAAKPAPAPAPAPAKAAPAAKPAPAPAPAPAKAAPAAKPAPAPAPAPAKQAAPAAKPAPAPAPAPAKQAAPAAKPAPAPAPAPAKAAPAAKPALAPAPAPAPAKQAAPAAKPAPAAKSDEQDNKVQKPRSAKEAKEAMAKKSPLKAEYVDLEEFYGNIADGIKPRGKITYEEYKQRQQKMQDSILSQTYHHGVTVMGASTHDKRYGDIDEGFDWSGGMGLYYFYRKYVLNTMAFQGRIGAIYRYGRFDFDEDAGSKTFQSGKTVNLIRNTEITYTNISVDLPLEFKIGGHIEPTTFLYLGLTFGVTKSIKEQANVVRTLDATSSDKDVAKDIEFLSNEGLALYPLTQYDKVREHFYMDDWETNGWVGVGVDGKYLSAEFQVLVASGSTKNNHRYYHLFHDSNPTWRVMVDFSMR